ncbi:hypothetical protein GCM10029992_53740 [Glycomyces albus]
MILTVARVLAVAVSLPTFALLILADRWRLEHLFFGPDLILCAALVASALLPRRLARSALAVSFAFAAGVVTTAVFSYVARDAIGEGLLTVLTALVCAAAAITLARPGSPERQARA